MSVIIIFVNNALYIILQNILIFNLYIILFTYRQNSVKKTFTLFVVEKKQYIMYNYMVFILIRSVFMSEKDFDKELNSEELNDENDSAQAEGNSEWKFDAEVPTLDDSVELSGGFELDMTADEAKPFSYSPENGSEQAAANKKSFPVKIVLAALAGIAIAAVLIFFGIRYYTVPNAEEKMNPGNIALTIGDTDISVGLYDYFYTSVVYETEQYASYGYNNLDTSKDYSRQFTEDKDGNQITWLEKIKQDTIDRIKTVVVYYEKGAAAGIELSEEQKTTIDEQISSLEASAANSGISVNEYVKQTYGSNCGVATLRSYLEKYFIAGAYYNQLSIDERPSDEEIAAYFNENAENYKSCSYAMIEMPFDASSEEAKAKSLENVNSYAAQITDIDSMKAVMPEASKDFIDQYVSYGYFESAEQAFETLSESLEVTESKSTIEGNFGKEIADWLFSADTAVGSTNHYINEDSGAAAILLKTAEPKLDETEVYSVRHILIIPESSAAAENTDDNAQDTQQTEYTDEEWQAAQNKADEILAIYNSGDKTEKSFALLAEEHSQDTESTSKGSSGLYGGAYEGVNLGQMVPEFESWATDKSRRLGDVGIVKSDYGYHVMYFIYDGPIYNFNAKNDLMQKNQETEFEQTEVKERAGMNKTKSAKPNAASGTDSAQSSAD